MRTFLFSMLAAIASADLKALHGPSMIPDGWVPDSTFTVPKDKVYTVHVGLKRSNVAALEKMSEEVSDPKGAKYLQYPTYEEMGDLVRPSAENSELVMNWLQGGGVRVVSVHPHGDYVKGEATVGVLEKMANGKFMKYFHAESGSTAFRLTTGVFVPEEVTAVIDIFAGFHGFPLPPQKPVSSGAGEVNPAKFRSNYNISAVPASGKQNIQAIAQFQGQYVDDADLAHFCTTYNDGTDCKISKYIGKNRQQPGLESMLDTEYVMSIGNLATTWVYSYPNFDFCADLGDFVNNVTAETTFPYSISVSYGSQKIDYCAAAIMTRFQQDAVKMGTMGITMMISSGDDGSGGQTRQGSNGGKLSPSFPASVPNCVAVGATYWAHGTSGAEQATTQFGSGGGFSYDFPVPTYQASGVQSYLSTVKIPNAQYAHNGRGSPDVSTLGESFTVVSGGRVDVVGGTSCSSPSFAGIVTLLNEVCLAASGKSLGFLNPLIYQNPSAFVDVTLGTNAIGENHGAGWEAITGWDAATGLGVPNFPRLVNMTRTACAAARK